MATDTPATRRDVFAQYGRNLAKSMLQRRIGKLPLNLNHPIERQSRPIDSSSAIAAELQRFQLSGALEKTVTAVPVGILGGGMAGLYTALMLASLEIPFQILEATDRIGGRCYTYRFEEGGDWDYYDVGAMRFPLPKDGEIGPHERLNKLFELLDLNLLDYIYKTNDGLLYYNGVHSTIGDHDERFKANELHVPDPYITAGVDVLCKDFIDPLAQLLLTDMKTGGREGWSTLKTQYDRYSTRSYLQFAYIPSEDLQNRFGIPATCLPTSVIDWMETFDKSSGWYDRALTETILEALAFGAVGDPPEWRCIQHGTSLLPEATLALAKEWAQGIEGMPSEIIVMNSPVTVIAPSSANPKSPLVVTAGGKQYKYSHVISTVPLPNFSLIDTSKLSISTMQRNAIRQLQYGPSIKIGMLFQLPWWEDCGQFGGQSFTDLPIRTIVYPSYGKEVTSNVLIASYCWTNDAEKLGNLIDTDSDEVDELLDDLVLRDLATVHGVDIEVLRKQHVRTYSWNWNHDAWTGGAFAFFGPGQYEYLYDALNAPAAEGRLQWAGELLSVRHAWIVGALDSAWAAVVRYLYLSNQTDKLQDFYDQWGTNLEWTDDATEEDEGDGPKQIPHNRNLLLKHMISHNPDLPVGRA